MKQLSWLSIFQKFHREQQFLHFGGAKQQTTLHTGPGRYSDRSLFRQVNFRQVNIPTGRSNVASGASYRSIFRQTGRYSDRSLIRQVDIPTGRYSDRSIFRQTGRYSDRSLFRQVVIPTGRYSDKQVVIPTNRSLFRQTGRYSDKLVDIPGVLYSDKQVDILKGLYSDRSLFRQKIIVMRGLTTINSYCGDN